MQDQILVPVGRIALFSFRHYCVHLRPMQLDDTAETRADYLHRTYITLLNEMQTSMAEIIPSLVPDSTGATNGTESFLSYNFVCTEDMMLLVPRRHKESKGTSINSLGFAGLILAKSPAELESIQTRGIFQVLADVGYPW
ncbi:bifunctional AP-4-A phosphorylase/ADP sulfurylase [Dispira simplex]|nr:bifunctional AP-4-A phosphorylase/ADP sulfurylase [Dispira simplex]